MSTLIKLLIMSLLIGEYTPYWGHTFVAEGNGKVYALRSLADSSSLCVFEQPKGESNKEFAPITLDDLGQPLAEVSTPGKHSCHIVLLARQAVVADYTSGTLSLFDLTEDGMPLPNPQVIQYSGSGAHPKRQQSPHIHSSSLSHDGKVLIVVDLGTDKLYRFDVKDGRVVVPQAESISLPAGCGPRHCAFAPEDDYLYVVTELSDEILVLKTSDFSIQNRYVLNPSNPQGGSHIAISADGKYLYASSRVSSTAGADTATVRDGVGIYKRLSDGKLEHLHYLSTGGHPRHFAVSRDGKFLVVACRDDNRLEIYPLDAESGLPGECCKMINLEAPVYVGMK